MALGVGVGIHRAWAGNGGENQANYLASWELQRPNSHRLADDDFQGTSEGDRPRLYCSSLSLIATGAELPSVRTGKSCKGIDTSGATRFLAEKRPVKGKCLGPVHNLGVPPEALFPACRSDILPHNWQLCAAGMGEMPHSRGLIPFMHGSLKMQQPWNLELSPRAAVKSGLGNSADIVAHWLENRYNHFKAMTPRLWRDHAQVCDL